MAREWEHLADQQEFPLRPQNPASARVTKPTGAFAFRRILGTDLPVLPIQIERYWRDSGARAGTKISPLPVALVEGRQRAHRYSPGIPNSLVIRKANAAHQINPVVT